MRFRSPSMPELHAFVQAARLGSFTQAADYLCVTQSAVSRAVSRLEAHLGKALFSRDAHHMRLTAEGRQFLAQIQGPLLQIETATTTLTQAQRVQELTLAVVPTWASVWLIPRLPDFHRQHPDFRLRFVPYRKDEDFLGDVPDAAVLTGLGREQWPDWWCDYLVGHDVVPVCAPSRLTQRRAEGAWTSPRELADEFLLYHTTAPDNWASWLQAAGFARVAPNLQAGFDQVSILVQAAIVDMGVALVQRCLIRRELEEGRLAIPFDLPVRIRRGYFLCTPMYRHLRPAFLTFREWLLAMAACDDTALMPLAGQDAVSFATRAALR